MGTLDNVRRIIREDYDPKYHDLVGKLGYIVNTFMEQVINQVNGNLDFSNLNQEIVEFKIKVDASGVPVGNNLVKTSIDSSKGAMVISALNKDSSTTYPTSTPFITFTQSDSIIKIKNITGLQTNANYTISIIVIG